MRSLRLDDDLEARVQQAAKLQDMSVSEFIRSAAAQRAAEVLRGDSRAAFADVIGVVHSTDQQDTDSPRGRARRTGEAFAEILASKR